MKGLSYASFNTQTACMCNNCGKYGHMYHQCNLPITSIGILAFRTNPTNTNPTNNNPTNNSVEFLMIRRKNSYGYTDLIRGKYTTYNIFQVKSMIDNMSMDEKKQLLTIGRIGSHSWPATDDDKTESISISDLVHQSTTHWTETEWEFPKGQRNTNEKDLECALREFEEETGILAERVHVIDNLLPFEEIFIGTNYKAYKHKYFLAWMDYDPNEDLTRFQTSEVSNLAWVPYSECVTKIRPYNTEKIQVIETAFNTIQLCRFHCA